VVKSERGINVRIDPISSRYVQNLQLYPNTVVRPQENSVLDLSVSILPRDLRVRLQQHHDIVRRSIEEVGALNEVQRGLQGISGALEEFRRLYVSQENIEQNEYGRIVGRIEENFRAVLRAARSIDEETRTRLSQLEREISGFLRAGIPSSQNAQNFLERIEELSRNLEEVQERVSTRIGELVNRAQLSLRVYEGIFQVDERVNRDVALNLFRNNYANALLMVHNFYAPHLLMNLLM